MLGNVTDSEGTKINEPCVCAESCSRFIIKKKHLLSTYYLPTMLYITCIFHLLGTIIYELGMTFYCHFTNEETALSVSLVHNIKHCEVLFTQIKFPLVEFVSGKFPGQTKFNICVYCVVKIFICCWTYNRHILILNIWEGRTDESSYVWHHFLASTYWRPCCLDYFIVFAFLYFGLFGSSWGFSFLVCLSVFLFVCFSICLLS